MAFLSLRIREHVSPFKNSALWKILGKLGNWEFDLRGPQRAPPFFLFTWSSFAGSSLFQKGPGEGAGRPDPSRGPHVGTRPAGPVIPLRRPMKAADGVAPSADQWLPSHVPRQRLGCALVPPESREENSNYDAATFPCEGRRPRAAFLQARLRRPLSTVSLCSLSLGVNLGADPGPLFS